MADLFTRDEWTRINRHLEQVGDAEFGLPAKDSQTILFGSWNLIHFGKLMKSRDEPVRSGQALELITNFCARCDLLAVQEVMDNMTAIRHLLDKMRSARPDADYKLICSDVTGRAPDGSGHGERHAFIYAASFIEVGQIASDLSFDLKKILDNVNGALNQYKLQLLEQSTDQGITAQAFNMIKKFTGLYRENLSDTIQFIRAPHFVTFKVRGEADQFYDLGCVNTHLVSGTKSEREKEFFTLLEFLLRRSGINGELDAPITLLLGDLNLDFKSDEFGDSNDARQTVIAEYVVDLNTQQSKSAARVNFPFLDPHPVHGEFQTNSRKNKTFDHIAWFTNDDRLPRARFNGQAGTNGFDYGMFDFQSLFEKAGPGSNEHGVPRFGTYKREISDHMPIWLRLPIPSPTQKIYQASGPDQTDP